MTYLLPVRIKLAPTGEFRKVLQMGVSCVCAVAIDPESMSPASEPDHSSSSCEFLGQEESGEVKQWKERGKSASVRAQTPVEPPGWELFLVYRPLPVGTAGRLGRNRRRGGPSRRPWQRRLWPLQPPSTPHAKSTETQRFEAFIWSHDLLTSLSLVAFVVESGAQQQRVNVL